MKAIKILVYVMLVIGSAFFIAKSIVDYNGEYCRETSRAMTNKDRIDAVVKWVISGYPPSLSELTLSPEAYRDVYSGPRPKTFIPYTSQNEFMALNPDCCAVETSTPNVRKIRIMDRVSGRIAAYVRVRYRVRYVDESGTAREQIVEPYYAITTCGHPWSGI
jgi:hypothetical protein